MDRKTAYSIWMNGVNEKEEPGYAEYVRQLADSIYGEDPDYDETLNPNRGED